MPALVQIPLGAGPIQRTTEGARGSFNGAWLLIGASPTPLSPDRDWGCRGTLKQNAAWPLLNAGFQDRFQGRYLRADDLGTAPAGCEPGSMTSLKLEGQFDRAGGVPNLHDTAKTLTSTYQKARPWVQGAPR